MKSGATRSVSTSGGNAIATLVGIFLILVGLACWVRAYAVLMSSNDPEDLLSQDDSSVKTGARTAGFAAYFVIGLIGLGFGISLL